MDPKSYERYSRQILFGGIGEAGQLRLLDSSAVIVGCGALGTALANLLVRAGVGRVRIVDRDFVEPSNLQRQTLFEESDAVESLPKAVAAERRLRAINSGVSVEGIVADVGPKNAEELLRGFPLILDGTDNFETRFLLNDVAIHLNVPWIYAAVVASYGVTLTVRPGVTACLACVLESSVPLGSSSGSPSEGFGRNSGDSSSETDGGPQAAASGGAGIGATTGTPTGAEDTCDTVGVLGAAAGVIASIQAAEAIKLLVGKSESAGGRSASQLTPCPTSRLTSFDVWSGRFQSVRVARNHECRACVRRDFRYLDGDAQPHLTMCGRDSVQIHERRRQLDLAALGKRIAPTVAEVRENGFLLRFRVPPYEMTVFADGRAIIKGTRDTSVARSLYARYIGA